MSTEVDHAVEGTATPAEQAALSALPMWLRADVGDFKLGIVHGHPH